MMLRLHDEARRAGSRRIRLTVDGANTRAVALYMSLGYVFTDKAGDRLIGFRELDRD
jgi:ribosomal protein S18 acetylase RimI-like enzyme